MKARRSLTSAGYKAQGLDLRILELLAAVDGDEVNSAVLKEALKTLGLDISRGLLHVALVWLQRRRHLQITALGPLRLVALTDTGRAAAGLLPRSQS